MTLFAEEFAEQLFCELGLDENATFYVAYSGGVDSHVLLSLMAHARSKYGFFLEALHVNHNLQANAALWAKHCTKICASMDVPLRQTSLDLPNSSESVARHGRYQWFAEQVPDNNVLMTAHHQQDRAETLLFNLMRGAGSTGLSGLRKIRHFHGSTLFRPLLGYSKDEVLEYAKQHHLQWVDDPSNQQNGYSRNHIRNVIIPQLTGFREDAVRNISRAAENLEQENALLREVAIFDLVEIREQPKHPCDGSHALCFEDMQYLSKHRQANIVRFWLNSLNLHTPSKRLLNQLLSAFESPPLGAAVLQEGGFQFRFYRGFMYAMPALLNDDSFSTIDWSNIDQPIDLYKNRIRLDATDKLRALFHSGRYGSPRGASLRLVSRAKIENPKALQGHSLNLKNWLQDMGIPPWRRQNIPLLTISQADTDVVLCPIDQQLQSDWVLLDCPVNH
ncbi:MAG: tRNA(Ile)-lysidine synthase [Arenicella sp.]|jgi:tRNA(Ile)-lysidine synthase